MRSKVTIVLLFLNVVLFYYIFYVEKPRINERAILEARKRVYGPEVATIDSIVRSARNGTSLKLERRGETWWLTQPYEWPANPNAVARMLNELQFLEHETSFSVEDLTKTGRTLAEYGLDNPAFTVTFTSAGKTYVSKVGDNTEIANRLYLLSADGTRVHVVSRSLADSVGLPLEILRSDSVFTIPVFEVRSLNVQTAALKIRLQRDANARWNFEAPIRARASKSKVEVTVNALNALTAKTFLDVNATDLERIGLNAPSLRVTLEGNLRRETLLLGAPVPAKGPPASNTPSPGAKEAAAAEQEYYAKIEDKSAIFTMPVPQALLDDLRSGQEKLRDGRVLDFEPRTVTALSISAPGEAGVTLQQLVPGSPPWQGVVRISGQAPLTSPADTALIEDLVEKLHLLTKIEFISDAPSSMQLETWGFNRPEREITLNLATGGGPKGGDPSTLTLQIGLSAGKGQAFARVTNAPFVYRISPDILEWTPASSRHYRQRLLRTLPEGAKIQGLALTEKESGTAVYVKELSENQPTWDAIVADEPEPRRRAIAALLTQLHTLRAKAFTAEQFTPDHAETSQGPRPWKYRLDATASFPGAAGNASPSTSTLYLTERIGGNTQLAGTAEFGGAVFEITQELIDALFTLTYREKNDPGVVKPPIEKGADPLSVTGRAEGKSTPAP